MANRVIFDPKTGVFETFIDKGDGTFARVVSAAVSVDASDIQIGAVEIKNATSDVRLIVDADGALRGRLIPPTLQAQAPSSVDPAAYAASGVIKASAGILFGVMGYNAKESPQFIQLFDAATVPADLAVPKLVILVPQLSNFSIDLGVYGRWFATGMCWSNSSTGPAKTIGAADVWLNGQYK